MRHRGWRCRGTLTIFDSFEAFGFLLGQLIVQRFQLTRRTAAPAVRSRARPSLRQPAQPPAPAFLRDDRVAFVEDGSVSVGQVVRTNADGRVLITRERDGKRRLLPAAAVRLVTRVPPRKSRDGKRAQPAQPAQPVVPEAPAAPPQPIVPVPRPPSIRRAK